MVTKLYGASSSLARRQKDYQRYGIPASPALFSPTTPLCFYLTLSSAQSFFSSSSIRMKRRRGFRLGRRLSGVWRRFFRRRRRHYLRLDRAAANSLSPASRLSVRAKLCDWGRLIARRFGRAPRLEEETESGRPSPKGHLAVYVRCEKEGGPPRRYTVPVIYFNHPLFAELLREAEEEFGFHHAGGITIPCPAAKFESVRTRIAAADNS
ncbi:hypothetical protein ZIOFF_018303 [Zingiber officinale]|uniref:Uncharacterized protein n=1 Tax=Zingiber officinale TaxID=94328 RepID=A0A8J5HQ80_ZINOF|nr:hypothetical protein ZIOFF_018303 [Zingiber officinale]